MRTLLSSVDRKTDFLNFFAAKFKQGVYAVSVSGRLPGAVVRDLVSSKNSIFITPPIAEILCVKNARAIVVCGFLMK